MRLAPHEVRAIRAAALHAFGAGTVVRLFGSRVDDERAGGDIDLYVEVSAEQDTVAAKASFEDHLFARIEEQQVDVIVHRRGSPDSGIDLIARRDGVLL